MDGSHGRIDPALALDLWDRVVPESVPSPPGGDRAAGPADAEPAPPPPQPGQLDASEDEEDPSFSDYHPFVVELRKRENAPLLENRHDIVAVIMRATDEKAKLFCRTYSMRPSASFACKDNSPYTTEIAMTMACEVQYRMQFFFDLACWRRRDPIERPHRFASRELNWCTPSPGILNIYNQADEDSRLRKRIDKILDIHPVNP